MKHNILALSTAFKLEEASPHRATLSTHGKGTRWCEILLLKSGPPKAHARGARARATGEMKEQRCNRDRIVYRAKLLGQSVG